MHAGPDLVDLPHVVSHLIDDRSQRPLPGRSFDEVANGVGDDLRVPSLIAGYEVLEAAEHLVTEISASR